MATVFVRGAMLYDTGGTTTVVVGNHAAHRVRTVSLGFIGFGGGFTVQPRNDAANNDTGTAALERTQSRGDPRLLIRGTLPGQATISGWSWGQVMMWEFPKIGDPHRIP